MEEISLCPNCYCMTKTVKGICGKCYKRKEIIMKKFRIYFSRYYSVDIEAESEEHAEEIFDNGEYNSNTEQHADTEITNIDEVED